MKKIKLSCKNLSLAHYVFIFSIALAVLSFLLFYLIDLRNFLGLRDVLINTQSSYFFFSYRPFFFQHWGRNSGFAELFQWGFLGSSAIIAAFISGREMLKNKRLGMFWILLSSAFVLMMLEDAGNIRHTLMSYVQAIAVEPDQGIFGTTFEFLYFAFLGGLPLFALIKYWKELKNFSNTKKYMVIGFAFYAIASGLSFVGTAFEGMIDKNIYELFGDLLYNLSLSIGDANLSYFWANWSNHNSNFQIGFYILDSLIEENLELIGGGAILASILFFLRDSKRKISNVTRTEESLD